MDLGSLFLALALGLIVAAFILRPLVKPPAAVPRAEDASGLEGERERIVELIRDLDFDHATGKLSDEDHAAQRARLVAEGVRVLKALDANGRAPENPDASIEAKAASRREASR